MKRTPMTEAQLVAHIERIESLAVSSGGVEIASEQSKAMDYYNNRPNGTEEEGHSQVISSDVFDVVEGLTPIILKPFVSSDDVVKFVAQGPEDEELADQESDYINYIVTQKNDAFEMLINWVKTGLLQKNGVVKYWWEKTNRVKIERLYGITDSQLAIVMADSESEITEHTAIEPDTDIDDEGQPAEQRHDVTIRYTKEDGWPRVMVIPPEEFRIYGATGCNPKSASFVQHATYKTISDLRELGYDIDDNINDSYGEDPRTNEVYISRQDNDGGMMDTQTSDPSMREVLYRESIMLVDFDGDGKAELRKICSVGTTILANEETEEINFCAWTPYVQAFQFNGKCPADETIEIQNVKTSLIRQTMDNIYSINNNRTYLGPGVNMDDYIDNQIGGVIRINDGFGSVSDNVKEATITPINAVTMPLVEYFDQARENRTGYTKYNQGTDSNSLNKTATGIRIISEAGNERIGLISRSFAEMGLKQLMIGIHGLCRRHSSKADTVRLRGKWVEIDPRSWRERYDMTVSVGLGTADKQMQMQGAQMLLDKQMEMLGAGMQGIVTPRNVYESASKLAQSVGEKNPDRFFTAPPEQPQEAPPPPNPMDDPEVMFKAAESKRKDREVDLKERELALKENDSMANHLKDQARLTHELETLPGQENEKERLDQETIAGQDKTASEQLAVDEQSLSALVQTQQTLMESFQQFMQAMTQNSALIAQSMAAQNAPKVLHVKKQADGSFIGVRDDAQNLE